MNMGQHEKLQLLFGPLKQGDMWKVRFVRVVCGCNKVMLNSIMELCKVLFEYPHFQATPGFYLAMGGGFLHTMQRYEVWE